MLNYFIKFVSATTPLTILPLYFVASLIKDKNYDIFSYVLTAPIWLGSLNVIWSFILVTIFGLTSQDFHYLTLVPISILCSFIIVKVSNAYPKFKMKEWIKYYILMLVGHTLFWYVGARNIDKLLSHYVR
jgi:hypothetical protein